MILHWIGLLQCVSGVTAVMLLLRCVFGYALKERRSAFRIALCAAAAAETGMLFLQRAEPDTADLLQEALILVCTVVFPYTLLRCGRRRTFLLFGLAYCATVDYIVAIVPAAYEDAAYVLIDALVCLLAVVLYKTDKKAPPGFLEQVPVWIYFAVFTADLSTFYSGMLNRDASYYVGVLIALRVLSQVLLCASILAIVRRILASQYAARTAAEQLAVQLRHYEQLVEKNRSVRAFRHDYENNLLSLGAILDAGQIDDAREYVRQLQSDVHSAGYGFATGSYLADAILSDKAAAAAEQGVQITFIGTVPERGIVNPDLCTILCNLLDNAVRGSLPCAPCTVDLDGRETADRWLLTVRNPVAQKVVIRAGAIRTSKADGENHGIGLANVRHAAEKYQGYLELQCDDHCFTAEVGLMLNTEETK